MVIAEGQWCPIIFAEYEGELCAFTSRAQFIALRKREKALYDIALECFAELCAPLPADIAKSLLDRAITARVNSMQDEDFTS